LRELYESYEQIIQEAILREIWEKDK